jgi:hypothetical protein
VNTFGSGEKSKNGMEKIRQQHQKNPRIHARWHVTSLLLRQPHKKPTIMNPTQNKKINAAQRVALPSANRRRH